MDDATPLNSSDAAATTDRRIIELLLIVAMIHYSLLLEEGAAADDDAREIVVSQEQQMTEILRECSMTINTRGNQSAVFKELLVVTQRLLDAQLRLQDGGEQGRVVVSSSASDQQLMDGAAAAKKKKAAAAKKKKRNKRNKAAAKRKGGTKIKSRLGGGVISLMIMMAAAFGSITTLITLSQIHQSDGSSEGNAPPTLPPSTSLRQRDIQSSMSIIMSPSPVPVVVQPPIFSPTGWNLAYDTTLGPIERNALSDFYDLAKGDAWTDQGSITDGSKWKDDSASYCNWKGVTCDDMKRVTKLELSNNGLSGRLSESIGNLTFIEVLDLSDNDIKGSIPSELGKLSKLTYLRLSYNAFTGTAPEGLGEMKGLQLLQLQSNRITEMPNIPRLDNSIYNKSTFVTDCGVPSAFDKALECKNCTMCCNANDECYHQVETYVAKWGLKDYGTFAAVLFACFIVFCCTAALLLYKYDRRKNRGSTSTRIKEDDKYALSKIGKESVYSYFVTDNIFGWILALVTLGIQVWILTVFINASETDLQDDKIDIQFTWKCPRDTDVCKHKADWTIAGWVIYFLLMLFSLAKDFVGGSKLIYHSAKVRHSLGSRIRYFFGGMCLCWITGFAFYVSTIYNKALATSNTEIIMNSVIILFVMDLDEWIFSLLAAINAKWTAHAEDDTIDELKEELRKLREIVDKIKESQSVAAAATSASECEGGDTNARKMEQVDEIQMPSDEEQNIQEPQAAAATSDLKCDGDKDEELQD